MIPRKRLAASLGLLVALMAPLTVEAAAPINVQVLVGDTCVSGTGGANKHVSATLRKPGGQKRDAFTTTSDSTGAWQGCFSLFLPSTTINGGDILDITVGSASRTLTVPKLTPVIDRAANTISAKTESNTQVQVFVTHHPTFKKSKSFQFSTVSDSAGNWSVNTTGTVNLIGEDELVVITSIGNDLFGALDTVPYMLISAVNNIVQGGSNVGWPVSVTLLDSHGTPKGSGDGGNAPFGAFTAGLVDANGDPAYAVGGDTVESSIASDASVRVPSGKLQGDGAHDVISGKCMANAPYLVISAARAYTGRTGADGTFSKSVASKEDLQRGEPLKLACMYPTGDVWVRSGVTR
jgi:hypothetical protein